MQEIDFLGDGEPEKRVSTSVMLDFLHCIADANLIWHGLLQ